MFSERHGGVSLGHATRKPKRDAALISERTVSPTAIGEGGIRTPGTLSSTLVFETSPISRSGTSPETTFFYEPLDSIRDWRVSRPSDGRSTSAWTARDPRTLAVGRGANDTRHLAAASRTVWLSLHREEHRDRGRFGLGE